MLAYKQQKPFKIYRGELRHSRQVALNSSLKVTVHSCAYCLSLFGTKVQAELVEDAHNQSKVTHGHINVQVCCAFYCLWARRTLEAKHDAWEEAHKTLASLYEFHLDYQTAFDDIFRDDITRTPSGGGFVIDSLFSAKWSLDKGGYEQVVKAAISLGNNTDTTACVAGGIAGLRDGVAAIPERWLSNLQGKELLEPLLEQLLNRY